ncbi:MAG: transcription termination factor NusA [Anaerolineales bacterium]
MKTEFALAFNEITERFGLPAETVMEALEAAMISAYRRSVNASSAQLIEVKILAETGEVEVFAEKEVVDDVQNPLTEVALDEAREVEPEAEPGDMVLVDSTPDDFGRVAAQTAKQVILQRLREAEREAQYEEYVEREGDMVHGTVHSITPQAVTVGLGRAEAILPRNQQIPGEHFRVRDRIRTYVLEVRKSSRGPVIVVSRTHPHMLRRLLEMEVPEINQGLVEIKAIAREAGKRAKVAVAALRDGVDPVGACVGMRGVRIQSIVRDLNDEKIDVIEWNPDSATFISKSLSPARVSGVYLDDDPNRGKTAMVVVPEDQLSLAIGRAGVNARLSAKLTGWRIDIKSLPEAAIESIALLESVPEYAAFADGEEEVLAQVESILTKKSEGRPVTPEEYQILRGFVERIQSEVEGQRDVIRQAELQKLEDVRASYPVTAYDVPLSEVGLSTRVLNLLTEADYMNAGALLEQLGLDEDAILGLQGIGPKAITEIREVLTKYDYPELEIEPVLEEEEVTLEGEEAVDGEQPEVPEPAAGVELAEGVEVDKAVTEAEAEEGATVVEKVVEEPETIEETFEKVVEGFDGTFTAEDIGEEEVIDEAELEELKKKKKEKSRVVEFDPDLGEMVVKRRRKRDDGEEWDKETF